MEKTGIKTTVIILLLIVNLAAAAVLTVRLIGRAASEKELLTQAEQYLSARKISVAHGLMSGAENAYEIVTYARSVDGENALALALVGSGERKYQGSVALYEGENGEMTVSAGGKLEAKIRDCGIRAGDASAARRQVTRYLSAAGLDLSGANVTSEEKDGEFVVKLTDRVAGKTVSNGKLTVRLTPEGGMSISGRWRMGSDMKASMVYNVSSAALIACYVGSLGEDVGFSQVKNVEEVAWIYTEINGALSVIPAFRVSTDQGNLYLDATDGHKLG